MKKIKVDGLMNLFRKLPKEKRVSYLAMVSFGIWLCVKILYAISGLFLVIAIGLFIYYIYLRSNKDEKRKKK